MFNTRAGSTALQPTSRASEVPAGTIRDLAISNDTHQDMKGYLQAFLEVWNRELAPTGEFRWCALRSPDATMLAVLFTTQEKSAPILPILSTEEADWARVLERCSQALMQPVSQRVFVDGMVRAVTNTNIFIIKRDERRLWTRSAAREDAEATMVQAMQLQAVDPGY